MMPRRSQRSSEGWVVGMGGEGVGSAVGRGGGAGDVRDYWGDGWSGWGDSWVEG
jgi:hypothetical protein